jgi:hypothetical protein
MSARRPARSRSSTGSFSRSFGGQKREEESSDHHQRDDDENPERRCFNAANGLLRILAKRVTGGESA